VEDPALDALDLAETGQAREREKRRNRSAMGRSEVADAKKNARRRRAWIAFQDESGISERPPVRRTWAPRGETPVLIHAFNWKKMSISAVLAYRWDGRRCSLYFQMRPDSYDGQSLIAFLKDFKREVRGRKTILIWDGLPAHKSRLMTAYLQAQRSWLTIERLPGYAPDLNPVESLWGNVKGRETANLCAADLGEAASAFRRGLTRVKRGRTLPFSSLRHAGLSL
jgi:transposase